MIHATEWVFHGYCRSGKTNSSCFLLEFYYLPIGRPLIFSVFRYDNAPHHKDIGTEVEPSTEIGIAKVISEIEIPGNQDFSDNL
jgi:hypothetical protein